MKKIILGLLLSISAFGAFACACDGSKEEYYGSVVSEIEVLDNNKVRVSANIVLEDSGNTMSVSKIVGKGEFKVGDRVSIFITEESIRFASFKPIYVK